MDNDKQVPNQSTRDDLNKSGTESSAGGLGDALGPEGDELRGKTDKGEMIGKYIETDNEGRVTQDSNTDI